MGTLVIAAPNLDSAVAWGFPVGLKLEAKFKIVELGFRNQPDIVMVRTTHRITKKGAFAYFPEFFVAILFQTTNLPAAKISAVKE
jgi:hypothetical protein